MSLVRTRAVLGNGDGVPVTSRTQMGSHALAVMEQLYSRGRRAHFHQFLHEVVRHAVKVRVEHDVVIDVDPCAGPLTQIERFGGQRGQPGLSRAAYCDAREPSRLRKGLWLMRSRSSRIAWFSSSMEKRNGPKPLERSC